MDTAGLTVKLIPLVSNLALPVLATPRTRATIPPGYGVQEECLPFTAATALGVVIPSPIQFGLCVREEVPAGCHSFRSPLDRPGSDNRFADPRVFYIADNPSCQFRGNAYEFEDIPAGGSHRSTIREPGLSFFDREDQQDLFKLHLPYIWKTAESVDTLFLPLLNKRGLEALSGLVETDWYGSPVNLVVRKPAGSLHVKAGDGVAQAIFIHRSFRKPVVEVVPAHARLNRESRRGLAEWDKQHSESRNAYKILARSRHGWIEGELPSEPSGESKTGMP